MGQAPIADQMSDEATDTACKQGYWQKPYSWGYAYARSILSISAPASSVTRRNVSSLVKLTFTDARPPLTVRVHGARGGKKMPPAQRRTLRWYRWCSFSREQRLRQTGETKCICDELQKHRITRQEDAAAAQRRQRSQHPKWRATANRTGRHASINGGARLPAVQPHVDEPNGITCDSFVLSGFLQSALEYAQPTTGPM